MQPLIQTRIQEPQRGPPTRDQHVVHQRQDPRSRGTSSAGPIQDLDIAEPDRREMLALGGDIGVAAAGWVILAAVLRSEAGDVGRYDGVLVSGAGEIVREAAAAGVVVVGVEGGDLGLDVLGAAHGGHVGAAGGEGGDEGGGVFAVVGDAAAGAADSGVAAGAEEGDSPGAELGELVADGEGVGFGHGRFVVAVAGADDLWDGVLREDVVEPVEVGLVNVSLAGLLPGACGGIPRWCSLIQRHRV